ncbi:urease accessory protein UreF [Roseibium suaedae]|uniref:Urease accessory protein UreF n=1 Tax=Roseibium suaedae TaxID=735517 RepID=A0A1M7MPZ5_9HYPH|nr:urease accessory protein UreF [Roseibium suaedae]SHM93016.1 urease accessory protein [Roseibium suaedae]
MSEALVPSALFRLLTFLSPAFPVGAFTYSHGLEQVIEDEVVTDAGTLASWLEDILRQGAGRSDAILLRQTMLAAREGNEDAVGEIIDLGLALQPSKERYLESSAQGTAFIQAIRQAWLPDAHTPACHLLEKLSKPETGRDTWPYPAAVGLAAAAWSLPVDAVLTAYSQAFTANLISVAVRAVPIGQSDGQRVLALMEPVIAAVAEEAQTCGLEDLGTSTFLADIASMEHETKYSRLFRS